MTLPVMEYNHHTDDNHSGISTFCLPLDAYPSEVFIAVEFVTLFLALGGFLGNGLTVLAILTSSLRTNLNSILIGNLSLAGAMYCSMVLPLQAVAYHHRQWVLPRVICVVVAAIRIWLVGVNMCLMSAIAFYRFVHVVHPQVYIKWTRERVFIPIIVFCWTFGFFFCATPLIGWGSYDFESCILQCTFNSKNPDKSHKATVVALGFVIPCFFISFCYARIGCVVYRAGERVQLGGKHAKAQGTSLRLTAMMLLIFVSFFAGTTPYFIINLVDPRQTQPMAHIWVPCAAWLLYSINPVIYTVMDRNFRKSYKQLLFLLLCKEVGGSHHSRQNSLLWITSCWRIKAPRSAVSSAGTASLNWTQEQPTHRKIGTLSAESSRSYDWVASAFLVSSTQNEFHKTREPPQKEELHEVDEVNVLDDDLHKADEVNVLDDDFHKKDEANVLENDLHKVDEVKALEDDFRKADEVNVLDDDFHKVDKVNVLENDLHKVDEVNALNDDPHKVDEVNALEDDLHTVDEANVVVDDFHQVDEGTSFGTMTSSEATLPARSVDDPSVGDGTQLDTTVSEASRTLIL